MIVEFALTVLMLGPPAGPSVVQAEFRDPVERVVIYPPEAVVERMTGLPLPPSTQQAFEDEFATGVFFGAFAVTKDGGYGYATGSNSIEAARDIAMQECLKQGAACLIYAELLPLGYVPLTGGQASLSPEAAEFYTQPDPNWGNFRAMAVSEDGAYSVVWNHATPEAARAAALADCAQNLIADLPDLRQMPCVILPFK